MSRTFQPAAVACASLALAASAWAQPATDAQPETCGGGGGFVPMPDYQSVEVLDDGRVTFRLCAPEATTVRVISGDAADVIPVGFGGETPGLALSKDDGGLWTVTTPAPLEVDTFRFVFRVNGVDVADPVGSSVIKGYPGGVSSVVETGRKGGAFQAYDKDVPHGAVSRIEYWSSLDVKRPAVAYTPPGYMTSDAAYPVLYLVHGAGDREDGWTAIGRAHYILDNLIAAGEAEPMIIVMPLGHTPPRAAADMLANTDFSNDLLTDLVPFIEANFRTVNERGARAMAGLSMGGAHTMSTGLVNPELFAYVGIFSMGLMSAERVDAYEARNAAALAKASESMKLVYYAMGKTDFLYGSVAPTRAVFEKYGITHLYVESEGGHTWANWRDYLADFLPRLFK